MTKQKDIIEPVSPFVIFPHPDKKAADVVSWKEIEEDARLMIQRIQNDEYKNRRWQQAYAMAHSQVYSEKCNKYFSCRNGYCDHHKNFFVVNRKVPEIKKLFWHEVIINPRILRGSTQFFMHAEGCMSDAYAGLQKKRRYAKVTVEYWVHDWAYRWFGFRKHIEEVEGLKAMIFQHETDHNLGKC